MGINSQIKRCAPGDLHIDALPKETRKAFLACVGLDFLRTCGWYLAGGTALALQVGHRKSVDLDFFTEKSNFNMESMERLLKRNGDWITTNSDTGTLYGQFGGAKMSFIAYPFFRPSATYARCGAIRILAIDDIAAMKIIALSQRGKKRDFIDIYWYAAINKGSLENTLLRAVAQYPEKKHSMPHFLKSLVYFEDAKNDPMPELHFKADWKTVKAYFRREVPGIAKKLLKL